MSRTGQPHRWAAAIVVIFRRIVSAIVFLIALSAATAGYAGVSFHVVATDHSPTPTNPFGAPGNGKQRSRKHSRRSPPWFCSSREGRAGAPECCDNK